MEYIKSSVEVVDRLIVILEANQETLGIRRVYYGVTDKIPDYPAICVESGTKDRGLAGEGATRRFDIGLTAEIYVYFGVVDSAEVNARENDLLVEAVEDALHTNMTLDNGIVFGHVARVDPGISIRGDTMVKVSRLTWLGRSRQTF